MKSLQTTKSKKDRRFEGIKATKAVTGVPTSMFGRNFFDQYHSLSCFRMIIFCDRRRSAHQMVVEGQIKVYGTFPSTRRQFEKCTV
jgi:hypothetical protein